MSGFEVAGIVLGTIPLVISALEHYRDGVSTIQRWRKYDRELRSLTRNLNIEKVKLQNICEKLLLGLVPPSHIEQMIETPFGAMWHDEAVKRKVRARLSNSLEVFESTVEDMSCAISDMMTRLDLDPEGTVKWTEKSSIVREFKRAAFTISRSSYADLLSTIKDGIANLETLTDQNMFLEPKRQETSQVRLLTILRNISMGLYHALRRSFACTCNHDVNLKLATRASDIIYAENEHKVLQDLDLHLALSYPSGQSDEFDGASHRQWGEVRILAVPLDKMVPKIEEEQKPDPFFISNRPNKMKGKRVNFQLVSPSMSSATATLVQTSTASTTLRSLSPSTISSAMLPNLEPILNLCESIRRGQKQRQTECYGFMADEQSDRIKSYNVYPIVARGGEKQGSWLTVTLTQALQRTGKAPPLSYKDKLRLAVVISTSVLQLYNTPWLPHTLSTDDILFIKKEDENPYDDAFFSKRIPEVNEAAAAHGFASSSIKRNPTLLSLGFILIELLLGKTLEAQTDGCAGFDLEEHYIAAQALLPRVKHESLNYFSAVSRCLDGELHQQRMGLDEQDFRQSVYSGVVALLKKDLDVL